MNTMKKEDMVKERGSLIAEIGYRTLGLLTTPVQLISLCQRALYLQNQIELATPKPSPLTAVPQEEKKDGQMDTEKTSA